MYSVCEESLYNNPAEYNPRILACPTVHSTVHYHGLQPVKLEESHAAGLEPREKLWYSDKENIDENWYLKI